MNKNKNILINLLILSFMKNLFRSIKHNKQNNINMMMWYFMVFSFLRQVGEKCSKGKFCPLSWEKQRRVNKNYSSTLRVAFHTSLRALSRKMFSQQIYIMFRFSIFFSPFSISTSEVNLPIWGEWKKGSLVNWLWSWNFKFVVEKEESDWKG